MRGVVSTATKSAFAKLLRSKGYKIPAQCRFEKRGTAGWLSWKDRDSAAHTAAYSLAASRPILQVDATWIPLTLSEVLEFGLAKTTTRGDRAK